MSLINISHLTFAYEGSYDNIFEDVSFQIDSDWKLGLVGRNGRGKTTFLNLLMRKYQYQGTISTSLVLDYFPFAIDNPLLDTLDVIDSVLPDYEHWKLYRELNLLEVSLDVLYRPFHTLSNGEQTKVLLAALFLQDNHFLLIDEPTNHLDIAAREAVSDYLKTKNGFILVSHDRTFLDNCIDHILSINKTNIEVQKGNFSSWWNNKELQDNYEFEQNEKLKKDIRRMEMAAKRTSEWSAKIEKSKIGNGSCDRGFTGHKAAKMMKRSKSIESRKLSSIQEKSTLLKNVEESEALKIHPLQYTFHNLISVENLSLFYSDKIVCENVTFKVEQGDKIALCGKNGSGKSSILKLICGEEIDYKGTFLKGSHLKISYVSQDTSQLEGYLSDYAQQYNVDESLFKAILRKLDFARLQFEKNMKDYSAGQKKKVLIARSLCEQAHLYIWDEPLNFIDVISRMQIEEMLQTFQPTILFVEHDKAFCDNIATKKVSI